MSDGILRLQHVQIRVPDLKLCTAYYTEGVGLIETAHEDDRVYLKCWDDHEHHSVVLRQAPTFGLDHYAGRVEAAGVPVKRYARRELGPGWGEAIRFEAPSGHTVELVHGMGEDRQHAAPLRPATPAGEPRRHRTATTRASR